MVSSSASCSRHRDAADSGFEQASPHLNFLRFLSCGWHVFFVSFHYRKSPILEAMCEFRLRPQFCWDSTLPGLFYERVRGKFPGKEQQTRVKLPPPPGTKASEIGAAAFPFQTLSFFFSPERNAALGIGDRVVSAHRLRPYPGWEIFEKEAGEALKVLEEVTGEKTLQSIALTYINRIPQPEDSEDPVRWFRCQPLLASGQEGRVRAFSLESELHAAKGLILKINLRKSADSKEYALQIVSLSAPGATVEVDQAGAWLERAHEEIKKAFEDSLTPAMKLKLEPVDESLSS
nr:TIGR04255 family protein [Verrucomicrobium sp. 3C]